MPGNGQALMLLCF
uniref:Uncharacterized protein n=1 Tax=Arundo donax TaxID=35708 RepID=A0A0A9FIN4_ARUDO